MLIVVDSNSKCDEQENFKSDTIRNGNTGLITSCICSRKHKSLMDFGELDGGFLCQCLLLYEKTAHYAFFHVRAIWIKEKLVVSECIGLPDPDGL